MVSLEHSLGRAVAAIKVFSDDGFRYLAVFNECRQYILIIVRGECD